MANCPEDNTVCSDDDFVIIIIVIIMIVMIIAIIMMIMREPEDPTLGFVRPHSSLVPANQPTALGSDQDVH